MANPKLIIFDVYGTLLKSGHMDYIARDGLKELLDSYPNARKVAFSDGNESIVCSDLITAEIIENFEIVYTSRNCISKYVLSMKDDRIKRLDLNTENSEIKNLEQACLDFNVSIDDTVFIGDNQNGKDKDSAIYHGIKFIQVPQYRENLYDLGVNEFEDPNVMYQPRDFSFKSLIGKL